MKKAVISGVIATVIGGIILAIITNNSNIGIKNNNIDNTNGNIAIGNNATIINNKSIEKTEVIEDIPAIPKRTKVGKCWTSSHTLQKPTAWRCMSKNEIYDPCIELVNPLSKNKFPNVICKDSKGYFVLKITENLPNPDHWQLSAKGNQVSKFETFDGLMCFFQTSATLSHYERLNYLCNSKDSNKEIFIMGLPTIDDIWTARSVTVDNKGNLLSNEIVKIKRVWK